MSTENSNSEANTSTNTKKAYNAGTTLKQLLAKYGNLWQKVIALEVKNLAKSNPNFRYVYPEHVDEMCKCSYNGPAIKPGSNEIVGPECEGCIFGQALQNLGWSNPVELTSIWQISTLIDDTDWIHPLTSTFSKLQQRQDGGNRWGDVISEVPSGIITVSVIQVRYGNDFASVLDKEIIRLATEHPDRSLNHPDGPNHIILEALKELGWDNPEEIEYSGKYIGLLISGELTNPPSGELTDVPSGPYHCQDHWITIENLLLSGATWKQATYKLFKKED